MSHSIDSVELDAVSPDTHLQVREHLSPEAAEVSGSIDPETQTAKNINEKPVNKVGRPKKKMTQHQIDDLAAKRSGIGSRSTAKRGIKVVNAIADFESKGDTENAQKLRKTLNEKSVLAAVKQLEEIETKGVLPTDAAGKKIPEHLLKTFECRDLFIAVLSASLKVNRALNALMAPENDEGTCRMNKSQAQNDLRNFQRQVSYAIPHAVCPYCKGSGKHKGRSCQPCKEIGWLVKSAYDSVPEDHRDTGRIAESCASQDTAIGEHSDVLQPASHN